MGLSSQFQSMICISHDSPSVLAIVVKVTNHAILVGIEVTNRT